MTAQTPQLALGAALLTLATLVPRAHCQVVINEIHYDPEPKTEHVEFIELHNAGEAPADLSGWQFNRGIEYTFGDGVTLAAGAFLVITENKTHFDGKFGSIFVGGEKAFAQWDAGTLSNGGELVRLVDAAGNEVDRVDYGAEFPWPIGANGDGVSMELIDPAADNDLGGSWRSAMAPTPGEANSTLVDNAPPQMRQVKHEPKMPATGEDAIITVKVTDPDEVTKVELFYQIVEPGGYIQSLLAKPSNLLRSSPLDPREPNPDFEDPANWESVSMLDNGEGGDESAGDGIYTVTLPGQSMNRTLVRYRILAEDGQGASVRVPYPDDESRNFAYFVYDGVPEYVADEQTVHPDGAPYTHSAEVMNSLPVYFLLTDEDEFDQCVAYQSSDQVTDRNNYDARSAFNWSGTFVYDGVVYDHIKYRLRQRNDRYGGNGKRSFRFRFNRGHYAQFHDQSGEPYPTKWRTLNSSKLNASRGGYNYGLNEAINHMLWNLVEVPANFTHWFHFRVVKARDEVPKGTIFGPNTTAQWTGDFRGMQLAIEDYDSRFLDAHGLPDGNLYKLISGRLNGEDVQRVQGKFSVEDGSDYTNILLEARRSKDAAWLHQHINYDHYNRYHAIIEAVRHFDVAPNLAEHVKNRTFYFSPPTDDRPRGWQHTLPWDSETSWGPNWNGGVDWVRDAMLATTEDREPMTIAYKNTIREVRDLIWQPDQINTMLDRLADKIEPFSLAERDRWVGGPREAGSESIPDDIREWVAGMKQFAWEGGSWVGGDGPTTRESKDSGISGQQGRDDYLDWLGEDNAAPVRPTITFTGTGEFPIDDLTFTTSAYKSGTLFQPGEPFAAMEWRLAEISDPDLPGYDPTDNFKWEWNATWASGRLDAFEDSITIPANAVRAGRSYRARVRMIDAIERTSNWSDPVQFTTTAPASIPNLQENLWITEIMYHPAAATEAERALGYSSSDFEFIELQNIGGAAIDLNGVRFTKGIDFDFANGEVVMLEPGATIVLVANLDAFRARYGDAPVVAGAFGGENEGRLDNGGELIKLSFGGGTPITEFRYNDRAPWPTGADGGGFSLVLASTDASVDLNDASSWVQSAELGGSPGIPGGGGGGNPAIGDDSDSDGMSDDAEVLAGTDPNDPNSLLRIVTVTRAADSIGISWSSVVGKSYQLEYAASLDASTWENVAELTADGGTASLSDVDATRRAQQHGWYRVRVSAP